MSVVLGESSGSLGTMVSFRVDSDAGIDAEAADSVDADADADAVESCPVSIVA